jgi:hypothetical protein
MVAHHGQFRINTMAAKQRIVRIRHQEIGAKREAAKWADGAKREAAKRADAVKRKAAKQAEAIKRRLTAKRRT